MSWAVRLLGEVRDHEVRQWEEPWWLMDWADSVCARAVDPLQARVFASEADAVSALATTPWVGEIVEV